MTNSKELERVAKELKNKNAKEWRDKNKEKVKQINRNYWLRKAQKKLEAEKTKDESGVM